MERDLNMHQEHRAWESDIKMWNDDVEMWQEEIKSLKSALINIEVLIDNHEAALNKHVNEFLEHQSTARTHEQNMGLSADDVVLKGLQELHEMERISHKQLMDNHQLLKSFQHEIMTLTKEYNNKLEQIKSCED